MTVHFDRYKGLIYNNLKYITHIQLSLHICHKMYKIFKTILNHNAAYKAAEYKIYKKGF